MGENDIVDPELPDFFWNVVKIVCQLIPFLFYLHKHMLDVLSHSWVDGCYHANHMFTKYMRSTLVKLFVNPLFSLVMSL